MKISELQKLIQIIGNPVSGEIHNGEEIRIIILQRGWVIIGRFFQNGTRCWISKGFVIRQWGTTHGLGELAINGPQQETVLDEIPETIFHELTIVASIICDKSKWNNL
jgi:hypothetical protein